MKNKTVRAIRSLLNMERSEYYTSEDLTVGTRRIAVIDGVDGNHRVREEDRTRRSTNQKRYLFRKLKSIYNNQSHELHEELMQDLDKLKNS
jgi:hypothetical protein